VIVVSLVRTDSGRQCACDHPSEKVMDAGEVVRLGLEDGPAAYERLLEALQAAADAEQVCALFEALAQRAGRISRVHERFEALLSLLFLFNFRFPAPVCVAFENLLCGLVSANAGFLQPSLELVVRCFVDEVEDEKLEAKKEEVKAEAVARSNRLHGAIQALLRLIPLGCSALLTELISNFPGKNVEVSKQRRYLKECLRVCEYAPILRDRIVMLGVERVLDIEASIRLDELEVCTMEGDAEDMNYIREQAEKVDVLLEVLFDFCDSQSKKKKGGMRLFELLLRIFSELVLPRKNCKFTQFLMFYICRKRHEYVEKYVSFLLSRSLGHVKCARSLRMASINYLGSFMARGLYIKDEMSEYALHSLLDWLARYLESFNCQYETAIQTGKLEIDPMDHIEFFAIVQAAIYMLIFKGNYKARKIREIFSSFLKPTNFLSQDIMHEFSRFATENDILTQDEVAELRNSSM